MVWAKYSLFMYLDPVGRTRLSTGQQAVHVLAGVALTTTETTG